MFFFKRKCYPLLVFAAILLTISSCITYEGPSTTGFGPSEGWEKVNITFERAILNLRGNAFYLMAITDNQFFRIGSENEILEKRILDVENGTYGRPEIADNVFSRITKNDDGQYQLEFHLTKNSAEIVKFIGIQLTEVPNELVQIDYHGRNIGAFNGDGTRFILPTVTFPNFHYTFFVFDIRLDPSTFHFEKVELVQRIDVPELSSEFNNIGTIRNVSGNFYIAAKDGGFKIDKDGNYERVSAHWMKDYFSVGGNLFGTAFEDHYFETSLDGGNSWELYDKPSALKEVTVTGGKIFSQFLPGHQFGVSNDSLLVVTPIQLDDDFPDDNNSYQAIDYFSNNFYLSVGKDLYLSPEITEEK
ncbi:MAG: hypothetical protein KDC24_04070 [Saprospiraceae bacterium]|nr:hypothetical protein [Saprospiraceae bacterium]